MQTEQKQQIMLALENHMQEWDISQSDMAKKAKLNQAYLINMRRGDFTIKSGANVVQIADKYFKRIAEAVGFETEKQYWQVRKTIQLKEIISTLSSAKENSEIAVITGETGCGKTFGCEIFQKSFNNEVFIIKVGASDNLSDLLDKILEVLSLPSEKRSKSARLRQIAACMKDYSENGIDASLIFDESEYMKQPALCALKELYDILNKWCSLVLIGTEQLTKNIENLVKKNKPGIPQFFRRIKFRISKLTAIDTEYKAFLDGLEPELKRWLKHNCNNYGELHDVLVPAMREAERTGDSLDLGFVKMVLGIAA